MTSGSDSMDGKTCVVTGASSGIGKATAAGLARLGASVVLVCRDRGRGEAALAEVQAAASSPASGTASPPAPDTASSPASDTGSSSGPPAGSARLEIADLSSMQQVRDLASRLSELDRIDVLVNNAGLIIGERRVTADGLEYTFALNHLAPFLLTTLLLGKLQASAPARVVTLSSGAHTRARLDLSDLQLEHGYDDWRAYSNSKLANILFTRELARRLDGTGVTANCVHPGVVRTRFGRDCGPLMQFGIMLGSPFMKSPASGADTVVYLASSPDVAGASGGYYVKRRPVQPSAAARDDDTARKLWQASEDLTRARV
jgi:NAD(P)-dependent dehydrogenase (short-subunit alcohol dehydrogenase family)